MGNKSLGHVPPKQIPEARPLDGDIEMMSEQAALMIDQAAEIYEKRLRCFVQIQGLWQDHANRIFTIDSAMMMLGLDRDRDATIYAIPSITKALQNLGCKAEKMIVFIPPIRIPDSEIVD